MDGAISNPNIPEVGMINVLVVCFLFAQSLLELREIELYLRLRMRFIVKGMGRTKSLVRQDFAICI
jgi:hypothetical protein